MAGTIKTSKKWGKIFEDTDFVAALTSGITNYMFKMRWYAAKGQETKNFKITFSTPLGNEKRVLAHAIVIEVNFAAGFTEYYFMTLGFTDHENIDSNGVVLKANVGGKEGRVIDAVYWEDFRKFLFLSMTKQRKFESDGRSLFFQKGKVLRSAAEYQNSQVLGFDQSNTSLEFNGKYYLKIYRRLFEDVNPDLELTRFLSDDAGFKNAPSYVGSITWKNRGYSVISSNTSGRAHV